VQSRRVFQGDQVYEDHQGGDLSGELERGRQSTRSALGERCDVAVSNHERSTMAYEAPVVIEPQNGCS